jgi:acyl dehydratase
VKSTIPISCKHLISRRTTGERFHYADRETMPYALGIGMGRDPLDPRELAYVFERGELRTVPTMATALTRTELLRGSSVDYDKVLHGEQRLILHRPLPPAGELIAESAVTVAFDKGAGKGAVILTETRARLAADGAPASTLGSTVVARGDGGFGSRADSGPAPHHVPERAQDLAVPFPTRADQALLYRLNGDRNPLHADPALVRRVGFPAPILHGLCTYGIACRAVLQAVCGFDHARIRGFDVRFSSPIYPGEEAVTEIWLEGDTVSFRCRVPRRGAVVVNNGRCRLVAT